jgi:hypothetical protein
LSGARKSRSASLAKRFRLKSWDRGSDALPYDFVSWIYYEMGRLGLDVDDPENAFGGRLNTVSELLSWMAEHPEVRYVDIFNCTESNPAVMAKRAKCPPRTVRPPIEIWAEINIRHNFSVSWYPAGWRSRARRQAGTDLLDFTWFERYPRPFWGRPWNELLFIRNVGHYRSGRGRVAHAELTNFDIVDSLTICAIRAAFNRLIQQLRQSFEVTLLDDFVSISWSMRSKRSE